MLALTVNRLREFDHARVRSSRWRKSPRWRRNIFDGGRPLAEPDQQSVTKAHQLKTAAATPSAPKARPRRLKRPPSIGVLVAGMHRSGTSALARTINLLGASLPSELLGSTDSNPAGHWEPQRMIDLHNHIFSTVDSAWADWGEIDGGWFRSPSAERFAHEIAQFLLDEFADAPLFVVKEPRLCRLLPLWIRAAEIARIELRSVLAIRHPGAVVSSLKARDKSHPTRSVLLWLRSVLDAEYETRTLPRAVVPYSDLMADWRGVMTTVGQDLDLAWPRWTRKAEAEIEQFLDPGLTHFSDPPQFTGATSNEWVRSTYGALLALAKDRADPAALAQLDQVRTSFNLASHTFGDIVEHELARANGTAEVHRGALKRERNAARERAELLYAEAEDLRARLQAAETNLQLQASQFQATERELLSERDSLSEQLKAADARAVSPIEESTAAAAQLQQSQRELSSLRSELEQQAQAMRGEVALRDAEIIDLRRTADGLRARLDSARADIERRRRESEASETDYQQSRQRCIDLEARLHSRDEELSALIGVVGQHNVRVAELDDRIRDSEELRRASEAKLEGALSRQASAVAELSAAKTQLAEHEADSAPLREQWQSAKARIDGLLKDVQQSHRLMVELRKQAADANSSAEAQGAEVQALRLQLDRHIEDQKRTAAEASRVLRQAEQRRRALRRAALADRAVQAPGQERQAVAEADQGAAQRLRDLEQAMLSRGGGGLRGWAPWPSKARRLVRQEIKAAGLFDVSWYLGRYPEARLTFGDALDHYLHVGDAQGHRPHPLFDPIWYRAANGLEKLSSPALLHFVRSGGVAGSSPHRLFDSSWYLSTYPDVKGASVNPLVHYLRDGWRESRKPHPLFDTAYYLQRYPDVAKSGVNPLIHYVRYGESENRQGSDLLSGELIAELSHSPAFAEGWYARLYPQVGQSGSDPARHYLLWGGRLGKKPHPLFDPDWYLRQVPEDREASLNPLVHFIRGGWNAGLSPHRIFDTRWYMEQNPGWADRHKNPLSHFVELGWLDGRSPHPDLDLDGFLDQIALTDHAGAEIFEAMAEWGLIALQAPVDRT